MKRLALLGVLGLSFGLGAAALTGCGEAKTPEQIEADKYPKTPPLTPEQEARGRELARSRPPGS